MTMKAMRPICRASAVNLLADADPAFLRPGSSLASGPSGNAIIVSARAMHIGSDHPEHWRALASIMSLPAATSTAAYEHSP